MAFSNVSNSVLIHGILPFLNGIELISVKKTDTKCRTIIDQTDKLGKRILAAKNEVTALKLAKELAEKEREARVFSIFDARQFEPYVNPSNWDNFDTERGY